MSIPSVSTIPWQFWFKGFYCVARIFASHIFACSIAHLFRARLAMPQCDWTQWKQSKAQIDSLKDESVIADNKDNKVQFLEFQVDDDQHRRPHDPLLYQQLRIHNLEYQKRRVDRELQELCIQNFMLKQRLEYLEQKQHKPLQQRPQQPQLQLEVLSSVAARL